jgi:uncharacterized 2Fe-2S/4Fe-4S cluster protein (DUF4445 family)
MIKEGEAVLIFQPYGKRLKTINKNVLEAAREGGISINSVCGGQGNCGKCKVMIHKGKEYLSIPKDFETGIFSKDEIQSGYRLSCQAFVKTKGTIVISIPYGSQSKKEKFMIKGIVKDVVLKPAVKKLEVHLQKPTLLDVKADIDRLIEKIETETGKKLEVDFETSKGIPLKLRKKNWVGEVTLWHDREIIDFKPELSSGLYGLAVDVGTTKIAGFLLDLQTGKIVATSSTTNPQIVYGEDVISRISFSVQRKENYKRLREAIVKGINWLIKESCKNAKISQEKVYDVVVAGNPPMHHILLGLPLNYLSLMPYTAALQAPLNVKARNLGLKINRGAYVHFLPLIGGFVGGDVTAGILATGIHKKSSLSMLIDIGTNTEIVLGKKGHLIASSCASGSAFEGAHIKFGMRAISGAIEHVWIDPKTLDVKYKTIDDTKPLGICGSGIIDIVSEMLKTGIIDYTGRFNLKSPTSRLRVGEITEFVLAYGKETLVDKDITITQSDVREVQLAKAAIFAAISILFERMEISSENIKNIFLAGSFGNYIDPQSAKIIGMYPDVPLANVQFVGNTAGSGACMSLLSIDERKIAEKIVKKIEYLELGANSNFQKEFLKATYLPHQDTHLFPNVIKLFKKNNKKHI